MIFMETYLTDVRAISYGALVACHIWKEFLVKGLREKLWMTPGGYRDSYGGETFMEGSSDHVKWTKLTKRPQEWKMIFK